MARSAAAPLLAAMLALMLVAGSNAQVPWQILGFFGYPLPPNAANCGRNCSLGCGIPPANVPSTATLQTWVSVEGCSF
jgi:hypothetical protein